MTALLEILCLSHEEVWSEYNTITYDIYLTSLEDTRRDRAEDIFLSFKFEGMTCVWTTLETCYYIILRGQYIDHLSFTFIAPLQTEQDIYFTVHFLFYFFILYTFTLYPLLFTLKRRLVPIEEFLNTILDFYLVSPAERVELADINELTHCSVWLV